MWPGGGWTCLAAGALRVGGCQRRVSGADLGDSTAALLLAGGALCNDAIIESEEDDPHSYSVVGDPTEGALAVAAARAGMKKENLEAALPRDGRGPVRFGAEADDDGASGAGG